MLCPYDSHPLTEVGAAGIVDPDGRWEAETMRYTCRKGHLVFVTEADPILKAEYDAADEAARQYTRRRRHKAAR